MTVKQNVPWWGRPEAPRRASGSDPVLTYGPTNPQWAAGWDAGNNLGLTHPDDQAWCNGYNKGWEDALDERFPGWRTPVDDDEE